MDGQSRILIVAGDDRYRELYSAVVRHGGYDAVSCENTAEAKTILARSDVDLAVVDVDAWVEAGTLEEELDSLRSIAGDRRIVVVLSEYLAATIGEMPPYVRGQIHKPFHVSDFLDTLQRALGNSAG